jgi:hypothetical protein
VFRLVELRPVASRPVLVPLVSEEPPDSRLARVDELVAAAVDPVPSCESWRSCDIIDVPPIAVSLPLPDEAESGSDVEAPEAIASERREANSDVSAAVEGSAALVPPVPEIVPETSCWI